MMHPVWSTTKTLLLIVVCYFLCIPVFAQKPVRSDPGGNVVKGAIVDTAEKKKLLYSIVALIDLKDTTLYQSVRTNQQGEFELTKIPAGRYTLMISYPKMADYLKDITITDTSIIDLETIPMITKAELLQEVVVRAGFAVRMRGDTLEYNADSFALKPGANVEDMLKRLPGMEVDRNGKIVAQGKEVKKILVDGDEFFSDDPSFASRYLQADAIDKVQVFDDKSDKTKFTGIDDGARTKTINLKLKKNRKNGFFGKLSAGGNTEGNYQHEAMGALFDGTRKISVFGMSSKTGKQDQSADLSQYVAQDYETINDGTGGFSLQGGSAGGDNITANGLPSVQSGGAHYSEKWNDSKQKLYTNYRIKQVNATGWSSSTATNVLPDGTSFTNKNDIQDKSYSFMQNGSGSFSFAVDSFTVVKVSANGSVGNGSGSQTNVSNSVNEKDIQVYTSDQRTDNYNTNKAFGSNISYQRKFRKDGRTFSFNLQQEYNNKLGDNYNFSANNYFDAATGLFKNADTLNQLQHSINSHESYAAMVNYSDKLSRKLHMSLEYGFKNNVTRNVFNTLNSVKDTLNNAKDNFTERVDSLSNDYTFGATTHITGAALAFYGKNFTTSVSGKALFTGYAQSDNDLHQQTTRHFINLMPQVVVSYAPKPSFSASLNYYGQTLQPTLDQLQPVRRSSNKLNVLIGNPNLRPGFQHNGSLNFMKANWAKGRYIATSIGVNYTSNSIATSTFIDSQNRTTSQYINLNSIPAVNLFTTFGWQYKKYNLRPALTVGVNKGGNYTIQNDQRSKNENLSLNAGFTLSHEWKNVMTTSYRGNLSSSTGWSDIPGRSNTRSLFHTHSINSIVYIPWHMEFINDCTFNFQPKSASFNTNFNTIQWNAFLQKKFLKNDQAVIGLAVNDILNNNTGYTRSVIGSNVSESNRFVLKRYWLLTMTWNFTKSLK